MKKEIVEKLREEYKEISHRDFHLLNQSRFFVVAYDPNRPGVYTWFWLCASKEAAVARAAYYNADAEFKGETDRYLAGKIVDTGFEEIKQ